VKLKQNQEPFLSTIKIAKRNKNDSNEQNETESEMGESSIVVIPDQSSVVSSMQDKYKFQDFFADDINTINSEFRYLFLIDESMTSSQSTLIDSVVNNEESNVIEMTLSTKEEEFLFVLMKSYQMKKEFLNELKEKIQVIDAKTSIEIDEKENETLFKLQIRFMYSNQDEIKAFISDFREKLCEKKDIDTTVEVEFNRKIDVDKDLDMLVIYLEVPERAHGGDIVLNCEKVLNERFLSIKFEDIKTKLKFLAQSLCETRSHKIYDYQILNITEPFRQESFEIDNRTIVLRNLMSEDDMFIELYAENLQKTNNLKGKVQISNLFPDTFYVEYEKDYDLNELKLRLERRKKKINKEAFFLQAYKTNTIIVHLTKKVDDIENSLKSHFCEAYKQFLQIRKLSDNFYLISYPTSILLNESVSEDKQKFLNQNIVFERLLSFDLLKELDSVKFGRTPKATPLITEIKKNYKEFNVDENFDPLLKVLFNLDSKYLKSFEEKFRKNYFANIVAEKKYLIMVYYDGSKTNEAKLKNLIKTVLDLDYKIEKINSVKLDDGFEYDRNKVYIENTKNGIDVIGVQDDVDKIVPIIKEKLISQQNNKFKELKIDDKFEYLIKALFHLDKIHLNNIQVKFRDYSTTITLGPNYSLVLNYDSGKYDEGKLKQILKAYFDINFKNETINNISATEIAQKLKFNTKNIYIDKKNGKEIEIIGASDDVEELVKKIDELKKEDKIKSKKFVNEICLEIKEIDYPLSRALFLDQNSFLKAFQQKFSSSYNADVIVFNNNKIKIMYDGKDREETALKKLVSTYLDLEFSMQKIKGINVFEVCNKIEYNKTNLLVKKINQDEIEIIGVEDDVEKFAKVINEYLNIGLINIENPVEFYVDDKFDPLVKVVFHIDSEYLQTFQKKFSTSYFANIIPEKQYKIKVSFDSKKTDEKKLKKLIKAYFDIEYKIDVIELFNIVEVSKKFKIDNKKIYLNAKNADELEIYGLQVDVENLVEQIKKDTNQPEGFAEFEIDESFDPLIKVVFHIDNNHLVDFQRKFETSYSANLVPQKKYTFKVFYDSKNTNEVKLKKFISAYLEMIFKIESVESIKLVDITEKLKYNHKNIHLIEKSGDSVEIFGVLEDVEKLVELINKLPSGKLLQNPKVFTVNQEFDKIVNTVFNIDRKFFSNLQNTFYNKYYSFITMEPNFTLKITYDSSKQEEKALKNLLSTFLDLELKNENIKCIGLIEILKTIEYNKKNVHIEFINDEEISVTGINEDVDAFMKKMDEKLATDTVMNFKNNKELNINEREEPLIKAVFHLHESHMKEFKEKFASSYFCIIIPGSRYNIKIYYNGDETNEKKVKNLISTYLEMYFKIETVSSSAITSESFDEKNICLNRINNEKVEIIGLVDDVDNLIKENSSQMTVKLSEFRILILKKFKANMENSIPNLKIRFDKINNNLFKINYENVSQDCSCRVNESVRNVINNLKKINFDYNKSIIQSLKQRDTVLFQKVESKGLICSFEYDEDDSKVVANVETLSIKDQVKQLLDEFISSSNAATPNLPQSKRIIDLKLFQYRIILINGYDRFLKKRWSTLNLKYEKKLEKYEIVSEDEKTTLEVEQLIKSFVSKIQSQKVGFNRESIEKLKNQESDFLKKMNGEKIFCVVEFDLNENLLVFYATNEEMIAKCKNTCHEYLKNNR
jgi:hypothetical protein